jgi:hypothetical protein
MVTLTNTDRTQPVVLHLDHRIMCGTGPCNCHRRVGAKLNVDKNGKPTAHAIQHRRLPRAITLAPAGQEGSTSGPLPRHVMRCPDVVANAKRLRVQEAPAAGARAVKAPEPVEKPPRAAWPPRDRDKVNEAAIKAANEKQKAAAKASVDGGVK